MSAQTSYSLAMAAAILGMKVDSMEDHVETFMAEEDIPFGSGVVKGAAAATGVINPTAYDAATEVFRGVALHSHAVQTPEPRVGYVDTEAVSVLRKGKVWVKVSSDVAVDAAAYADHVNENGQFTDVSTNNGAQVGIFRTAATSGNLAVLELNLP